MTPYPIRSLCQPLVVDYNLPDFVEPLKKSIDLWRPKRIVKLGMPNTPAYPWFSYRGYNIHIKRDDLTGCELSGNKVRKLEFLLGDAVEKGCQAIITCGGLQSNHCRATAACAARLGLECHLFLCKQLDPSAQLDQIPIKGNMLLSYLFGAHIHLVSASAPHESVLVPHMQRLKRELQQEKGITAHIIPGGGSNAIGSLGYIQAYDEMLQMGQLENITDICFACGSGGTAAGLAIANYLSATAEHQQQLQQIPKRIHAFSICHNADYLYEHVDKIMERYGLIKGVSVNARDILDIDDSYVGPGYSKSTPEHIALIRQVVAQTGIVLDGSYTGKTLYGVLQEIDKSLATAATDIPMPTAADSGRDSGCSSPQEEKIVDDGGFWGKEILFIHTGGIFGSFDGRWEDETLLSAAERTCRLKLHQ